MDLQTFRATFSWLWDRPELLSRAAFLVMVGVLTMAFGRSTAKSNKIAALAFITLGTVFLVGAMAWPTGQPLPAIAHGKYRVVQMKNTGASLFLVASSNAADARVKSWWIWQRNSQVGWSLPSGGTAPDYVDGQYRGVELCVGGTPEYSTFITICPEGRQP